MPIFYCRLSDIQFYNFSYKAGLIFFFINWVIKQMNSHLKAFFLDEKAVKVVQLQLNLSLFSLQIYLIKYNDYLVF